MRKHWSGNHSRQGWISLTCCEVLVTMSWKLEKINIQHVKTTKMKLWRPSKQRFWKSIWKCFCFEGKLEKIYCIFILYRYDTHKALACKISYMFNLLICVNQVLIKLLPGLSDWCDQWLVVWLLVLADITSVEWDDITIISSNNWYNIRWDWLKPSQCLKFNFMNDFRTFSPQCIRL